MNTQNNQLEGSVLSYINNISKYFDGDYLKRNIKQTSNGIFVNEQAITEFIEGFDKHLFDLTQTYPRKDFTKSLKKLFATEQPVVNYLIEGKSTSVGYVISTNQRFPSLLNLNSITLDSKAYLHPRDPLFDSIPGLSTALAATGLDFKYTSKHEYLFNLDTLKAFQKIIEKSKILISKYPNAPTSLRVALTDFIDFINILKKPNYKIVISNKFPHPNYLYLSWNKIILTVQNSRIVQIYNLRGPSFNEFVDNELKARINVPNFTQINSGSLVGKFEMPNRNFKLTNTILANFIADNLEANLKYLKNYFTVKDAIEALAKLLTTANNISEHDLPFSPMRMPRISYYENLGWYFAVDQNKNLVGITTKFSASRTKPQPKR